MVWQPPRTVPHDVARKTAMGRLFLAAADHSSCPDGWSERDWQRLRVSIRDPRVTVLDDRAESRGVACIAAPVWSGNGRCLAAVGVMHPTLGWAVTTRDLVARTAREIESMIR